MGSKTDTIRSMSDPSGPSPKYQTIDARHSPISVVDWCAERWWRVGALGVTQAGLLLWLFSLSRRLAETGVGPAFDVQNGLTVSQLVADAVRYGADARARYAWFVVVDCVFPPVASLFLAALVTRCVDFLFPAVSERVRHWAALTPLAVAAFDLCENAFLCMVVYGHQYQGLAPWLAIAAKRVKLASLWTTQGIVILMLVGCLLRWTRQRVRKV
jgi:hypothetical protein